MKRLAWLLAAWPAAAHMISMSSGDLAIRGVEGHYELRIPLYEVAHIKDPGRAIWQHIHFRSAGVEARMVAQSCREEGDAYRCSADYRFSAPVEPLEVECTLYEISVPNHVHLLRAVREGRRDQALFDAAYSRASLRFETPGAGQRALSSVVSGAKRALGGPLQLLFLACLVLAARSRRELSALGGMFLLGQAASAVIVPAIGWQPAPRFVEAAAALAVAYLAGEILLLPGAHARWVVAGILGTLHGLYFALFLETSGENTVWVLAGAAVVQAAVVAAWAPLFARLAHAAAALRPVQVSASVLMAGGMVWFVIRLAG